MLDIVTIIEFKAESLGYHFEYGKKDFHNLLRSDMTIGKIYFLLDPLRLTPVQNKYGNITSTDAKGTFFLAVKSNLDNVIHRQKEQDKTTGKYRTNIRPLLDELEKFVKTFNCEEYTMEVTEAVDIYNYLSANLDGLIVTFNFKEV